MQTKEPTGTGSGSRLYGSLLIVFGVLLAVFWSVHPFFMWAMVGALTLVSFLYYRSLPKTEKDYRYQREQEERTTKSPAEQKSRTGAKPQAAAPSKAKPVPPATLGNPMRWIGIGFVVIVGLIFLFTVLVVFLPATEEANEQPVETVVETTEANPEDYRQQLVTDPNNKDVLTELGNYHYEQQAYDSALVYYDRIIRLDSKNSVALYNKGLVLYQLKKYDQSISILRLCLAYDTQNTGALQVMGNNYYDQQQYGPALDWYQKAYDLGARDGFLCHAMAWMYDERQQTNRAIPLYKEALSLDSTRTDIYVRLASLEPELASLYLALETRWKPTQ